MALKTIIDFVRIYGEEIVSVVQSCDGCKSLIEIAKEMNIPIETLLFVAEQMVLEGLLEVQQY
jgi:aminopeptidase-like protein